MGKIESETNSWDEHFTMKEESMRTHHDDTMRLLTLTEEKAENKVFFDCTGWLDL